MKVVIDGQFADALALNSGVPQGSLFGKIPFWFTYIICLRIYSDNFETYMPMIGLYPGAPLKLFLISDSYLFSLPIQHEFHSGENICDWDLFPRKSKYLYSIIIIIDLTRITLRDDECMASEKHRALRDYWASNTHLASSGSRTYDTLLMMQVKCSASCNTIVSARLHRLFTTFAGNKPGPKYNIVAIFG